MLKKCLIAFFFCLLSIPYQSFCQVTPLKETTTPKVALKRAVAIVTFENLSAFPENDWVGASFAETLSTKLSKTENIDLYERRQLNKVITENGLNQKMVSEEHWNKVKKLGQTLHLKGVQSLLIGSVAMMGSYDSPDTPLNVNARIINVETGEITRGEAFGVKGKFSELFDLQTRLARDFLSALGVKPTSEEEQRIREQETDSLMAYRLYILGLQGLDEGKYGEAKQLFYEAYRPRNFPAAKEGFAIASEWEIKKRERTGIRDELGRIEYAKIAEADASQGALGIYYLGRQRMFDGRYDEAIKHYQTFLEYTQNKVLRWKYETKGNIKTYSYYPPSYYPSQCPLVVLDGMIYIVDEHALYALESESVRLLWTFVIKNGAQPVIANGIVYISDIEQGVLYALQAKTGEVQWQSNIGVRLGRKAIIEGNIVYLWSHKEFKEIDDYNTIYALSRIDGALLWKHDIGARRGHSSPITVSNGIAYIFSASEFVWNDSSKTWDTPKTCTLSALKGATGELIWESQLPIAHSPYSDKRTLPHVDYAPVVSEDRVYVLEAGSQSSHSYDVDYLYALSSADGRILWRSHVKCAGFIPLVSGDSIYIPSHNGVYEFNLEDGSLNTEFIIGKETTIWDLNYSLMIADGILFARPSKGIFKYFYRGGYREIKGDDTIYAFDLETRDLLWEYCVTEGIQSNFTVVNNNVYFVAMDRMLYTLNAKTGQVLWKYELGSGGYSDPTVYNGSIYVSKGNTLYALNATGLSSLNIPSDLDAQVAIGRSFWMKGDLVTAKKTLLSVIDKKPNIIEAWIILAEMAEQSNETQDAVKAWQRVSYYSQKIDESYQISLGRLKEIAGLQWRFSPSPTFPSNRGWKSGTEKISVTKNNIYINDLQGQFLYKLEPTTGRVIEKYENGRASSHLVPGVVYLYYNGRLHALDAQTESMLWSYEMEIFSGDWFYALDQTLFVRLLPDLNLYAFSAKKGNLIWKSDQLYGIPIAGFGEMVYCFYRTGLFGSVLYAISTTTGELLWTYEIGRYYPDSNIHRVFNTTTTALGNQLVASDDCIYISTEFFKAFGNTIYNLKCVLLVIDRESGDLRWEYETKDHFCLAFDDIESNIIYVNMNWETHALNAKTGEFLWKQPIRAFLINKDILYGTSNGKVLALNSRSGQLLWQFKFGHEYTYFKSEISKGILYIASYCGTPCVYALDAITGKLLWEYHTMYTVMSIKVAHGMLYILNSNGELEALDIQQASKKLLPSPD